MLQAVSHKSQFIKSLAIVFPFSQNIYESLSFDEDLTFIFTHYIKISVLLYLIQ